MKLRNRLKLRRKLRRRRVRAKITGTPERPRLSVFRSNRFIYVQIIDDVNKRTLLSGSDRDLINGPKGKKLSKTERARELGKLIAKKAKQAKITKIVFDRGAYRYHGRIKAVADGAREGGLEF